MEEKHSAWNSKLIFGEAPTPNEHGDTVRSTRSWPREAQGAADGSVNRQGGKGIRPKHGPEKQSKWSVGDRPRTEALAAPSLGFTSQPNADVQANRENKVVTRNGQVKGDPFPNRYLACRSASRALLATRGRDDLAIAPHTGLCRRGISPFSFSHSSYRCQSATLGAWETDQTASQR